tara:strand:- start:31 stop:1185 length:1155 start_codon:yes stop_codon:yes gene_type:complete
MLGIAGSVTNSCDITHKLVSNQGSALFDGTNDFIDASSVASDISLTAGSISLWARITTTSGNESFFNVSDGTSGANKLVIMYNTSSAVIQANYKAGGASQQAQYSISNSAIVSAGWFHIVMTYDTTANEVKLYYNGSLVNTRIIGVDAIDGSSVTFDRVILGKSANADNTYHQGYIDEYAYFARVLSATEVARIYGEFGKFNYAEDLDLTGSANALKQWLRFGNGSAGGLNDVTTGIVDMSNGSLGGELVINGGFDTDSNWTKNTGWSISGGVASSDGSQSSTSNLVQNNTFDTSTLITDFYLIRYTVTVNTGSISFGSGNLGQSHTSSGTYYIIGTPATGAGNINFTASATFTGTVDNVSVRKINGNHAFASGALINQNNLPG